MKLSANSYTSIASTVQTALKKYASAGAQSVITDFHLYPDMVTGELSIFNDDEELLAKTVVKEWVDANPEGFQGGCEMALKKVLNQLSSPLKSGISHLTYKISLHEIPDIHHPGSIIRILGFV